MHCTLYSVIVSCWNKFIHSFCHDFEVTPEMRRLTKGAALRQQDGASVGRLGLYRASYTRDASVACDKFGKNLCRSGCKICCKDCVQILGFFHNPNRRDTLKVGRYEDFFFVAVKQACGSNDNPPTVMLKAIYRQFSSRCDVQAGQRGNVVARDDTNLLNKL